MKIYGNSKSDGFPLLVGLVGALFAVGGVALAHGGGVTLVGSLAAFAVLTVVMLKKANAWDVLSDVVAATDETHGADHAVVAAPFAMPAVDETSVATSSAPWSPSTAGLPAPVVKPKSTVETNTHVA
jgi:hypothetical protein